MPSIRRLLPVIFSLSLVPQVASAAPINDAFADAIEITSLPLTHEVAIGTATGEAGEPAPSSGACGASRTIWYRYTPTSLTNIAINAQISDVDTHVALYDGSSLGDLRALACAPYGRLEATPRPGREYFIQINASVGTVASATPGNESDPGTLTLRIHEDAPGPIPSTSMPLSNDDRADAMSITTPFADPVMMFPSTQELGEPNECIPSYPTALDPPTYGTAWYRYEAPSDGTAYAEAFTFDWMPSLGIYEETASGLTFLRCADITVPQGDYIESNNLATNLPVDAGHIYYFQLIDRANQHWGGWNTPASLIVRMLPEGDLSVDAITVTPNPGVVAVTTRRIGIDIGLVGAASSFQNDWSIRFARLILEACPLDASSASGCTLLADEQFWIMPSDDGHRRIEIEWTPEGCIGDVELRAKVEPIRVSDRALANNTLRETVTLLPVALGAGAGTCPLHERI